jgi:mannose-6-phosphate isomerase-like protein (cupin superfamily)
MYILSGRLIAYSYDSDTDQKIDEMPMGSNDAVFIPTMEPHGFINPSDDEDCTFLCCIANVYEEGQ